MSVIPCAFCGYDSPGERCPHCGGTSADGSLAGGQARTTAAAVRAGLAALPSGLRLLASTRGTKRWLVPPFVLTTAAFAFLLAWAWNGFERLVEYAKGGAARLDDPSAAWYVRALDFVLESWAFVLLAKLSGAFLLLGLGFYAALYAFSLFYEAISGPFLDEVQGRIETRWFGVDPRNASQRPTTLSVGRCAALTAAAAALAALAVFLVHHYASAWRPALFALAVVGPFLLPNLVARGYGRWLAWALRVELATLWTSVRTSAFALLLLLFFLPLKFVPLVGPVLFAGAAGFATAISLLDIPFSRRQWSLGQRLAFLGQNVPALAAFGTVASLLFLIPFAGPVLMVPAASIGGLWLFVRLDKSRLRTNSARIAARAARPAGPEAAD